MPQSHVSVALTYSARKTLRARARVTQGEKGLKRQKGHKGQKGQETLIVPSVPCVSSVPYVPSVIPGLNPCQRDDSRLAIEVPFGALAWFKGHIHC